MFSTGHILIWPRSATISLRRAPALACALLCTLAFSGCKIAEAHVHNLDQLHDPESHHRYSAALEGDFEFFLRHKVLGLVTSTGAKLATKSPSKVDAPADECLKNLIELEQSNSTDPVVQGRMIEWFARLAVEDPWSLSRERAITALAAAGVRLAAGMPAGLGGDQKPADGDAIANALTPLVKALRSVLDKSGTRADLEAACDAVRALDLDLGGARRALRVVVELQNVSSSRSEDAAPVGKLAVDLQRLCIKRALSRAIDDPTPRVRGAALASVAKVGGRVAIDTVLFDRLRRDPELEVAVSIVDTVAAAGLSRPDAKSPGRAPDEWLGAIYALIEQRHDSEVRLHAMMALAQLSGSGIQSLREEDWQSWWLARSSSKNASASGAAR